MVHNDLTDADVEVVPMKSRPARELPTPLDIHRITGDPTAAFCVTCARSAEGKSFAQWLDEQWTLQQLRTSELGGMNTC